MNKLLSNAINMFVGPNGKKVKKPKKKILFYFQYRMARVMLKRKGIFLGLLTIYVLTFNRLLDRIFTTYRIEPSDEEKHRFMIDRVNVILNARS